MSNGYFYYTAIFTNLLCRCLDKMQIWLTAVKKLVAGSRVQAGGPPRCGHCLS